MCEIILTAQRGILFPSKMNTFIQASEVFERQLKRWLDKGFLKWEKPVELMHTNGFVETSSLFQTLVKRTGKWWEVAASWTCVETCVGWPNALASFFTRLTRVVKKTHFKADISCVSLANNTLLDVTQVALTWVGWPNGEKLALSCVQIWSRPKLAQVIAKRSRK